MPACTCPVCGHSKAALRRARGPWRVFRCPGCSVAFLNPRPSVETLRRHYNTTQDRDYEAFFQSEVAREEAKALADRLTARHGPGRVLDVGSGFGVFLEEAAARGWDIQGVEISTSRVAVARERWIPTFHGTVGEAGFPAASFDLITLRKVLDHLPDPGATLRELARLLKPGGTIYLSCPDTDPLEARILGDSRNGFDSPVHLFQHSFAGLEGLLGRAGFRVVEPAAGRTELLTGAWWSALRALGSRFRSFLGLRSPARRGLPRLEVLAEAAPAYANAACPSTRTRQSAASVPAARRLEGAPAGGLA